MERYREALDAFNKGLKLEPENAQLAQGLQQVGAILIKRNFKKVLITTLFVGPISIKFSANQKRCLGTNVNAVQFYATLSYCLEYVSLTFLPHSRNILRKFVL
jgi:hypothetical protein